MAALWSRLTLGGDGVEMASCGAESRGMHGNGTRGADTTQETEEDAGYPTHNLSLAV